MSIKAHKTGVQRFAWLPVIAGLVLIACGQPAGKLEAVPALSVDGVESSVAKQLTTARARFDEAPLDPALNGEMGMLHHTYSNYEVAGIFYRRAAELDRDRFGWHYLEAVALQQNGRPQQALAALERALKRDSDYVPARLMQAELKAQLELPDAASAYAELTGLHPDLGAAWLGLGQRQLASGDTTGAIESLQQALRIDDAYGAAHYALATAYSRVGKADLATVHRARFEQTRDDAPVVADPELARVMSLSESELGRTLRALQLIRKGRLAHAARLYEKIVRDNADNLSAHANLIGLYGNLGDSQRAEAQYRKGIAADSSFADFHNNIGVVRLNNRRLPAAQDAFQMAVAADDSHAAAHRNLGAVLEKQGQPALALTHYLAATEREPHDRQARFFAGRLLSALQRYEEAAQHLNAALQPVDNKTPHYLQALADVQRRSGAFEAAQATLAKARELASQFEDNALLANLDADARLLERARSRAANPAPTP